eukprot:4690356-Alexandrium_andersonii.AAC.1
MSASLVGSEMCIRDSTPAPAAGSAASPPPMAEEASAAPSVPPASEETAVSYTHLTLPTICSV